MLLPIICLDSRLRQFLADFGGLFSKPQFKYFVTILLGLMLCQETKTLSGLLRQVNSGASLSGASRFLAQAPWLVTDLMVSCQTRFRQQLVFLVQAEHARQRSSRPSRRGRPKGTVVTGYLLGDDSTMHKVRGQKMGGLGRHYSSTAEKTVPGHSLVMGLYRLLDRRCPLEPQMYRQKAVCEVEGVPFRSKVEIMSDIIRTFVPVPNTQTHVLLDSWYTAKRLWRVVRERGFEITSGLRCHRQMRVEDPTVPRGWRWQRLDEYAAQLRVEEFQLVPYPSQDGGRLVYVHRVVTRIRKLYRCQVIFIRETLDGSTRYWASTDVVADVDASIRHIATRWDIEMLFADTKELLGLDHYQLMSATAIRRFWALVMVAYLFLDEERDRLRHHAHAQVTVGDAWREGRRVHWCHFLDWVHHQFLAGLKPADLYDRLTIPGS